MSEPRKYSVSHYTIERRVSWHVVNEWGHSEAKYVGSDARRDAQQYARELNQREEEALDEYLDKYPDAIIIDNRPGGKGPAAIPSKK